MEVPDDKNIVCIPYRNTEPTSLRNVIAMFIWILQNSRLYHILSPLFLSPSPHLSAPSSGSSLKPFTSTDW